MNGVAIKGIAALRGHDPPPHSGKELHPIVVLQLLDGQTHRGLGQVQRFRRPGDAALLIDSNQNFHMPQGHGNASDL